MNIETVKELAEILARYNLTSVEVCEGEARIKLDKAAMAPQGCSPENPVRQISSPSTVIMENDDKSIDFNNIIEVKSPVVGVFYSAASPEDLPFVTIGSKVKKGDVLCIVEAMKLMNEVTAEVDGEIVDICIKNGDIVEYGQVLFKMF